MISRHQVEQLLAQAILTAFLLGVVVGVVVVGIVRHARVHGDTPAADLHVRQP